MAWDRKVWDAVAAAGFDGPLYDRLADQLIRYALPRLRAATRSGVIFRWCQTRNPRIKLWEPRAWGETDRDEVVIDTIAAAEHRLRRSARAGRAWCWDRGASLGTYFMGLCIDEFPNRFHAWLSRQQQAMADVQDGSSISHKTSPDPADVVINKIDLSERLAELPDNQNAAVTLKASGFNLVEIADRLGVSPRAAEGLIYRARQRLRPPNPKEMS